jgi:FKBP-type peptidyl-prolyl cis-trans isomerase
LASCQQDKFIKHEKGFEYLFFEQNQNNKKPKLGDVMVLNMSYSLNNDSLLFSSEMLNNPFRMKLKKNKPNGATIDDALSLMHMGDSACFILNANLFYTLTKKQKVPMNITHQDKIYFYVKLKEVVNYEDFVKQRSTPKANTPEEEMLLLDRYLKMGNIQAKPLASGLYFIEDIAGQGPLPKYGQTISLHYNGYFVNGQGFSNTYESGKPFDIVFGKTDLIKGFEEGLSMMKNKGHYTLIIPSHLAYGSEGNQSIPANKTLIFEIDILNIE